MDVTKPWEIEVELLGMSDVEIPQDMQHVMAMEARLFVLEAGAEINTTTVVMFPADFVRLAGNLQKYLEGKGSS